MFVSPRPVTDAPRALMNPLSFQVTQSELGPAFSVGWSSDPVSIDCRTEKVAPSSVLR